MKMIDTHISVETPESIELHLIPAGPVPRILAYSIDWLIKMAILIAFSITLSVFGEVGTGIYLIIFFVIEWFYGVFFEMLHNGMTPGKSKMGIQVVHDDGTPLNWGASVLRNILRAADFFPFAYLFGIISMVTSQQFKRLGDHAAGTLVVYRPQHQTKAPISQIGSRPAPFLLDINEQQAILAFAERSERLTDARQQELADILAPVLPIANSEPSISETASEARVMQIKKIANGIIGQS
ncbi:MAG: putative RDD family membrane protein YckC [Phenylobacterium sp.]|jgi:uncharacterized RDD family membrane protein YckC